MPLPNPQRVPLGTAQDGSPVYITREWLRFFDTTLGPTGSATGTTITNTTTTNVTADEEAPQWSLADAQAKLQAVFAYLERAPAAQAQLAESEPALHPAAAQFIEHEAAFNQRPPAQDAIGEAGASATIEYLLADIAELKREIQGLKEGTSL